MAGLLCGIPFAALLFGACAGPGPFATGYVEGDYTLVAPVSIAQIDQIIVARGDRVSQGDLLVKIETRDAKIDLAEAEATLARAQSQLADLQEGKRPEEISVIEASLASALAQSDEAARASARIASLAERGAATKAQQDDAETAARVAEAKVAEIRANLAVARLPARPQEIAAAKAAVQGAHASRDKAEWNLEQRRLTAPANGRINDVIRTEGELAGPSAPVLSMLADGAVKLRLYVPETSVSQIVTGTLLSVQCDGCNEGLTASVIYVAEEPEFTPPVIYSLENRQKLVYLVEAKPTRGSALKPGQIVEVRLPEAAR